MRRSSTGSKRRTCRPTAATNFSGPWTTSGVLIKSQQGREGGVLAGIVYHMGYVRDQYGVSRALLALGHSEEARGILEFYHNIWKVYGYIQNAQAIGYPGIFHRHENDETEITGYLVVQAFDYFRKTNDAAFLERILPMLEWATQAQQRNLIDGMRRSTATRLTLPAASCRAR